VVRSSNIRAGPSAEDQRVTSVGAGATLYVIRKVEDRDWYQIETEDGLEGFIYAPLIRPQAEGTAPPAPAVAATAAAAAVPGLKECARCPEMVMISPGRFLMGTEHGHRSERPVHPVAIGAPFALGKYELTVGEWQACVDDGGCRAMPDMRAVRDASPVHNVSWEDAQHYVSWLRRISGKPYRLPTEAEWEYAARGGTTTAYWWGDDPGRAQANCEGCGEPWTPDAPAAVASYPPNPFGLHGVSGGVMEWVEDCWIETYEGAPEDVSARTVANCTQRVLRGGSWLNDHTYATTTSRLGYDVGVHYRTNGLRVARDLN
jgi:formylglycine-generating enzyme required for sulfatase activity